MLQYRQNINYFESQANSIEEQIQEFAQLLQAGVQDLDLYMNIRDQIYKEIKIQQLACTRVLRDILQIEKVSGRAKDVIVYFIVHNTDSYRDIAKHFNCTKQNIQQIIKKYSSEYVWLDNLRKIKGLQDAKNKKEKNKDEMDF